jgi:hypothetical protein|tara:strand:+ start:292 stop:945 length:654 start_codon:yes stop_codon:yes gene_type:complete
MKTELSLYTPNTETSTKLFYKVYPYRITYPRLGRLHRFYFQGNEPSEYSREMRQKCLTYLKKEFKGNIKFNHGYHTHAYFLKEEDFEKAKEEFKELHIKYTVPLFPDLKELLDKFDSNVQLRKSLFLRKFKYKVEISYNFQNFTSLCDDLFSTFDDNPNYAVSGNIKSVTRRFGYYGSWATYSVYCKDKIDVEYFTFMFGENIKSITKAVLISELDK